MIDDFSSVLRLITPAVAEPLTLDQAKAFLRIDQTADDVAITTAITVARQAAESYLRMAILPQTFEYVIGTPSCVAALQLPWGPAQSIVEVVLTDAGGDDATLASDVYRLSIDGFVVLFASSPTGARLTVQYVAGAYASVDVIPAPILQGMLHHIAVMMEDRDGSVALPPQSVLCYSPFRRVAL